MTASDTAPAGNPLLAPWTAPFGLPPFESIEPEHYKPAFDMALTEQRAQIATIADNPDTPTFANTIEALEMSGQTLKKVGGVFFNLAGSHTNDAIQAVEREMAPILAKHRNSIFMNEALYRRVAALYEKRDGLGLTPEQARVLDRYHTIFVRAGAKLGPDEKKRLAAITERLASLGTQFSQNVLADERSYQLVLDGEADLEGLPSFLREAAAQAAEVEPLRVGELEVLPRLARKFAGQPLLAAVVADRRVVGAEALEELLVGGGEARVVAEPSIPEERHPVGRS